MTFQASVTEQAGVAFRGGIAEGANVRTPCGARRVELVRPGDMIVTRDCGLVPVRMVWSRTLTAAEMAARPDLAPVRLKPRAIGPMMPQRDLVVAPEHRLLVPGYRVLGQPKDRPCFVEAKDIAGTSDSAFVDRSADSVRFFTFVFDSHQVFAANGLVVESFLPTAAQVASLSEDFREALVRRYPQLRREPSSYPPAEYAFVSGAEYLPACA